MAEGTLYAPEQVCMRLHVRACMHACMRGSCLRACEGGGAGVCKGVCACGHTLPNPLAQGAPGHPV